MADFDFAEMLKQMEFAHLYKIHPHFDKYPKYMQDALIANERLQGRITKETPAK
jgi:hypothetical protein